MDQGKEDMVWHFTHYCDLVSEQIVTSSTVFDLALANKSWSILITVVLLTEKNLVHHFFSFFGFVVVFVVGCGGEQILQSVQ